MPTEDTTNFRTETSPITETAAETPADAQVASPFVNNGAPCWNCALCQHETHVERCARCNVALRPVGWAPSIVDVEAGKTEDETEAAVSRETASEPDAPVADSAVKAVKSKKGDAAES
ncbi:hypothetical protein CCAX7_14540 [Capsulimonas corticalis]|uniref:Uncharacterized protein n=1 Tax=Capsulimonas corticalis TaxID=2219043 RepID=A0A402CZJ5_9BACT|nr:hypothetical protein [Capsulimonas corticalis]BDI29403.1 hypothetical protein CCAX7_14540 [Capsulimonas corticalis]